MCWESKAIVNIDLYKILSSINRSVRTGYYSLAVLIEWIQAAKEEILRLFALGTRFVFFRSGNNFLFNYGYRQR